MKRTLRTKLAVAATAASLAVAGGGAGLAAASTGPAATSGTEHFHLMTTQASANRYVVVATGVFTAGGIDLSGNTTDTVKLPHGTFKIHHGGKARVIKESMNQKTCLGQFEVESGFTLGNGTGVYKKISGSGKAIISVLAIAARTKKGACNFNANPATNEQTISATAHIKL
jgi:hypothetical protein